MFLDPRALIMFAANALLLHLMLMGNSALAGWSIYLFLPGAMLVLPALYLQHRSYFLCMLATGLWVDAALPVTFGCFTLLFLTAGAIIIHYRFRFRAEHNYHPVLIAHAVNFLGIVVLILTASQGRLADIAFWVQVLTTSLFSHLTLLLVAPWFFDLQRALFDVFQLDSDPDDFPTV